MQHLFNNLRVGLFLDAYRPHTEKRRGEDTKVVQLHLRVQPFDVRLAAAIDDGLQQSNATRASLFNLSTDDPKANLERVSLRLVVPPQTLRAFAAPDAEIARLALPQVKLSAFYARKQKDIAGWALCFTGTYGEVGKDELEYFHYWYRNQQFVIFEESEPSIDTAAEDAPVQPTLESAAPTWDDGDAPTLDSPFAREAGTVPPARRRGKRTGRHDPEATAAAQREAGAEMGDEFDAAPEPETVQ